MTRNEYSVVPKSVLGTALAVSVTIVAAGAAGVASADEGVGRFSDSYAYFFSQPVVKGPSVWRQSHPGGLANRELQALGSSDLSPVVAQINPPVLASAPADPTWRQAHPSGLTDRELLALSSSSVSRWEIPDKSGSVTVLRNIARSSNMESSFFRRMFTSSSTGSR